jgi:hypothetical protein
VADDDDITTSGGEWPPEDQDAPPRERSPRDEDTLPTADRPRGGGLVGPDDDDEDYLPPTGAHEVVFQADDGEEEEEEEEDVPGGQIPSFEEYRRQREAEIAAQAGAERDAEGEALPGGGGGEHEYARRMFGGPGSDAGEEPAGEHHGHGEESGDTLDGDDALEGVTLPEEAGLHASSYEEELAREAADLFPTGYEHTPDEIHERRLEAHRRHRRNGRIRLLILVVVIALVVVGALHELGGTSKPPAPVRKGPSTPTSAGTGKSYLRKGAGVASLLPGNLLISDWGSRKLLVISPTGQQVWDYQPTASYKHPLNPDYAFFTDSGKEIVISEESRSYVEVLQVAGQKLTYTYGHFDRSGSGKNYLHDPSAALEEGDEVVISDIRNCRVITVKPPSHAIVATLGTLHACAHKPPTQFDSPVSAFPMADGGTVITELGGGRIDLLSASGKLAASFSVPGLDHPANVNETPTGDLIGVDHTQPGAVVIFTTAGKVLWSYHKTKGFGELLDPAMAYELPGGDVIVSDEYHDRVIVIDRKTKTIVWQYGHTGVPSGGQGYLDVPVGLEFVPPHALSDQFPGATPPR